MNMNYCMNQNAMTIDQPIIRREREDVTVYNELASLRNSYDDSSLYQDRDYGNRQGLALAMAYVPFQCLKSVFPVEVALQRGTLFPDLYKPFQGARGGGFNV